MLTYIQKNHLHYFLTDSNNDRTLMIIPILFNADPVRDSRLECFMLTFSNITSMFVTDDEDNVARAIAIRCEEKGGIYYNNEEKINNEKVAVADIAQFVAQRTMSQYEEEFEVVCFSFLKQNETDVVLVVYVHL